MNSTSYDMGHRRRGEMVEVTITAWANVFLVDATQFRNYAENRQFTYFGGLSKQTPVRLTVPYAGHWHVVVDVRGLSNGVTSTARLLHRL